MINDKQMKYLKSEDGMDYYLFTPTLFKQYYNPSEDWTPHRKRFTHKLHMAFYYLRGGYKVLYLMDKNAVAAYVVFTRCGELVINNTTRKDIFTIFITTHPDYRRKGLATKIGREMLHGIGLEYEHAYKTIADSNIASQKAAYANGYQALYPVKKSRVLKTVSRVDSGNWKLYTLTY